MTAAHAQRATFRFTGNRRSAQPGSLVRAAVLLAACLAGDSAVASNMQIDGVPVHDYTLPNGLRVWHVERLGSSSMAIVVDLKVGSRNEEEHNNGIAHLLEHYVHGGTRRWSAREVDRELDRVGGIANATTGRERTRYFLETVPSQLDAAVAMLAEIVVHPTLPPERLVREREVVTRENGGPDSTVLTLSTRLGVGDVDERQLYRRLFPGSTLDLRPIGTTASLANIKIADLRDFHRAHYRPNNATLVVSGGVPVGAVRRAVERHFGDWQPGPLPERPTVPGSAPQEPIRIVQRGVNLKERGEIWVGARTERVGHIDGPALSVLAQVLQARLMDRLRTQEGLVYGVSVGSAAWSDGGDFRIAANAAPHHLDRIEKVIGEELDAMRSAPIATQEVSDAKHLMLTRRALQIERNLGRALELLDLTPGSPDAPLSDAARRIAPIEADDLMRVAQTYLTPHRTYVVRGKPFLSTRMLFSGLIIGFALLVVWYWVGAARDRRKMRALDRLVESLLVADD